eukprot:12883721-Prorocentrum_lima.AAC.1
MRIALASTLGGAPEAKWSKAPDPVVSRGDQEAAAKLREDHDAETLEPMAACEQWQLSPKRREDLKKKASRPQERSDKE